MQLPILDPNVRFTCGSCTACCDQPWRTLIEANKAEALDRHDFSNYAQLSGRQFYWPIAGSQKTAKFRDREQLFELAKGEGTRCLFLDRDGLCIIHKELGPEAKPAMCLQFPFLPARLPGEDRVSANYGCPSVQNQRGAALTEQADEIAAVVRPTRRRCAHPLRPATLPFDWQNRLGMEEADAFFNCALRIFEDDGDNDLWSAFARLVALLVSVQQRLGLPGAAGAGDPPSGAGAPVELLEALRSDPALAAGPALPRCAPFPEASIAPMPVRMLFAVTLYPDTVPFEAAQGMNWLKRLTLVPRLLSLARLSGGYASRLLRRNISIHRVLAHPVEPDLEPSGASTLKRYFRSRLWQRFPAGARLPVTAGIHQHILDFNAILFLARAEACEQGEARLSDALIRQALTRVEFHLANQRRLHEQVLRGWLRPHLADPRIAFSSLRLMCLRHASQDQSPPAPGCERPSCKSALVDADRSS